MKLVFATHNQNKFIEVQALMPSGIELQNLDDIGCHEDIPETADTIEGNALLKASHVLKHYGLPCFADDTGLEIPALNNEPGVYSARYAGPGRDVHANMDKVLSQLRSGHPRAARFKTVIALVSETSEELFTGIVEGEITGEKRGDKGFGYDPIFLPEGFSETFAEMSQEDKNQISHRGRAIQKLLNHLGSFST